MCLAIPGQVIEVVDEANQIAKVDVVGVRRNINVSLLADDGDEARPGDWVLIHVGFALSKVDEEEAHATLALLQGMGARLRAGARGAEGERDRVSSRPPADAHREATASPAATRGSRCGRRRSTELGARCRDADGTRSASVEIDARRAGRGPATRCSSTPAPRSARPGAAQCVKYVDEYRDAELGRALAAQILAEVEPGRHYKVMEVCGGHTHSIYKYGIDDLLPAERRARARPRLPGLRDPDGPRRRRDRDRPQRRRDLHLLRRHAARAGLRAHAARRQGRGRRRADGLLAARRAADRAGEPRPRGRVLRDRLRDDGAVDGADAQARQGRGHAATSPASATT